jgi:hypothetical protein
LSLLGPSSSSQSNVILSLRTTIRSPSFSWKKEKQMIACQRLVHVAVITIAYPILTRIQDRERHFREQITALEAKVKTLQTELQTKLRPPYRNGVLSTYIPSRPDSRASTVMVDYDGPATSRGTVTPPNQPSVWDSIHAPMTNGHSKMVPHTPTPRLSQISQRVTPKNRALYDYKTVQRQATASPTPSVVSVAPTLGDDGWWA